MLCMCKHSRHRHIVKQSVVDGNEFDIVSQVSSVVLTEIAAPRFKEHVTFKTNQIFNNHAGLHFSLL